MESDSESLQSLELTEIEKALDHLANNTDKSIFDSKVKKSYSLVEEYKEDSNALKHIVEYIDKLHRPLKIEVGTVGAYLWGCSQNYYGSVNSICSPLCSGSIPRNDGKHEMDSCQYQIWVYSSRKLKTEYSSKETSLSKQTHVFSSRAYIYVHEKWTGFTQNEIQTLKDEGILFATVLKTQHSKHQTIIQMTAIDELPIIDNNNDNKQQDVKENSYILLKIFIVLMLLVMIFYLYRKYMYETKV